MRSIKFVASGYGSWPLPKPNPATLKPADLEKLIQQAVEKRLPVEVEKALFKQRAEDEHKARRANWRAMGEAAYQARASAEAVERMEKEKKEWDEKLANFVPESTEPKYQYPKWYTPATD